MDWGSIASAVGGAAKVAMSNAPEASKLEKESAASERHRRKRELDAKLQEEKAEHEVKQQRIKDLNEKLTKQWQEAVAVRQQELADYFDTVGISVGGYNNFVLADGVAGFTNYPTQVQQVLDMANEQNNNARAISQLGVDKLRPYGGPVNTMGGF